MRAPIDGIDVSHHQPIGFFKPDRKPENLAFAYVRASYGKKVDKYCDEHVRDLLKLNIHLGLYLFVRDTESVDDQWNALTTQFDAYGYSECLVPAIDAEWQHKDRLPDPKVYVPMVNELLSRTANEYGEAVLYTNLNFFKAMKSPAEWLQYPWWLADYSSSKPPVGPNGKTCLIWQHSVENIPGFCSNKIDQNSLRGKLPHCN